MKKILYLTNTIEASGGMERVLIEKANWFVNNNYEVTILSLYGLPKPFFKCDDRIKIISLNLSPIVVRGRASILTSIWQKHKLEKTIKEKVSSSLKENTFDVLFTQIHISGIMRVKDGSLKIYESHMSKLVDKYVSEELNYNFFGKTIFKLRRFFTDIALKQYDYFVVLTEDDRILRGAPKNSVVIPNPITNEKPHVRALLDNKQVISLGRLSYQKGYDYLIDAWKFVYEKFPDWKLQIYGGWQDCRDQYDGQIKSLDLQNVITISDAVSDVNKVLLESSIYVMSSRYEGFGLVLTEAMNCGVPCVSFACKCGPSDIITDGVDGCLVKNVGDTRCLADCICKLIRDENLRKKFGYNASINVERFNIDNIMSKWVELIKKDE